MKSVFILLAITTSAFAAPRPFSDAPVSSHHTYLGFASDSNVTGSLTPAVSALLGLSETLNVQTYFLIPTIDPFLFSIGANAKVTVFGNQAAGFHMGGGLGFQLGTAAAPLSAPDDQRDFTLRFNGIAGAHFLLVNRIMIIADGGMTISLNTDKSDADLVLGGNSAILGLSVLYEI